jgi:hypothetical protein
LPRHRAISRIALVCAVALAGSVAGCKNSAQVLDSNNEGTWFSKPVDVFASPEWANLRGDQRTPELGPQGPVGPDNLVGADGRCSAPGQAQAAAPQPAPAAESNPNERLQSPEPAGPQVVGGIGLGMSECDAVRRAGVPGNVNIGTGNRGERTVVLTYLTGPWPGIYHFSDGRLKVIERAPEQPKPAKAPPKKKTKQVAKKPKPDATQVR